jgi:hypothetical protein
LLEAIANEFTLEQAVEFKAWHGNLSPLKNSMLMEWIDD